MLSVKGLNAGYEGVIVVREVSFEVGKGDFVAIVGSNGAGKSTTLKAVSGLIRPASGSVHFDGADITGMKAHQITALGLAHVPEGRRLFPKMSVMNNLLTGAHTIKDQKKISESLEKVMDIFPVLKARAGQKAETLSGGEQQMVAIARGLMCSPKMLLVDETSLGLMPTLVDKVLGTLKDICSMGITVLAVEQKVEKALKLADRAYVMQTGRIVMSGTGRELLASDEIRAAYMGF
ncbi:MAG TPA: ABC transporter ATP-binding protein [Bacillota bacterium]|nr:ABC transporter ATP-binding protein [Bacillota bacterium]OPZ34588.1 MAG: High-affinity branched-chain amino acid transport ATP-binding protein LivF [Synergistetes bacterium ADurb.BinA166]HOA14747.1 ABC transporter ATP-binding protein [Bacillota bacterium]HOG52457.1 ABC transporter ATP-binding protein [Bacillota bacterium]